MLHLFIRVVSFKTLVYKSGFKTNGIIKLHHDCCIYMSIHPPMQITTTSKLVLVDLGIIALVGIACICMQIVL